MPLLANAVDFPDASSIGSNQDVLILSAGAFPTSTADYSFVERNKILAQGYEPFEAVYDSKTGKCIRNCVYSQMSIEDEIEIINRDLVKALEAAKKYAPLIKEAEEEAKETETATAFPTGTTTAPQCLPNHPYIAGNQPLPRGNPLVGNPKITSDFGKRIHPVLGELQMHYGIDFSTPVGTPVFSPIAGMVEYVKYANDACGYQVKIRGGEFAVRFCHLSKMTVNKGDFINSGCQIGYSGNTGLSTGPHLHYEIYYQSRPIPPRQFL